jgi:hypothetical protein
MPRVIYLSFSFLALGSGDPRKGRKSRHVFPIEATVRNILRSAKPASPNYGNRYACGRASCPDQCRLQYSPRSNPFAYPLPRYCCSFEAQRLNILTRIRSHGLVTHPQLSGDRNILLLRLAAS